jgi:hypothetical protein
MLFELVFGRHPIWDKDQDDRKLYRQKLADLTRFNICKEDTAKK